MNIPSKKLLKEQYKNRVVIGGVYAIHCCTTGQTWLRASTDMQGSKNRFAFCVATNSYPESCVAPAWKTYGADCFSFEVLEEIEKQELQTTQEFSQDVSTLLELWNEKRGPSASQA